MRRAQAGRHPPGVVVVMAGIPELLAALELHLLLMLMEPGVDQERQAPLSGELQERVVREWMDMSWSSGSEMEHYHRRLDYHQPCRR